VAAKNAQEFIEELNIELADDEIHDWIYSAWQAATEAAEEKFISTNTGSPKLLAELHDAMLFSSAGALYKTTDLYQKVCEQLRAGA